jgi:hypothetical protein
MFSYPERAVVPASGLSLTGPAEIRAARLDGIAAFNSLIVDGS